MAFNLSKLNFFSKMDARARVAMLFGGVIGIVFLGYLGVQFLSGGTGTIGPSHVASAPSGLQSVPGGALTAEYSRALQQANKQSAKQAQMSGGSAVPTLMNFGGQPTAQAPTGNCNIVCSDQSVNVKNSLDEWVKQGKVSPEVSTALQQLAASNVSVGEYGDQLNELVKEGKLTPEQARELLEQYKKQHANTLLNESAKVMDDLIKSGKLPLDVANQLLTAQKNNVSPAEYAAQLQELVREGKISPEVAAQLLAQYTQQHAKEVTNGSIASLHHLARNGEITPEVEKELVELETKMVSIDVYTATLQRFVSAGKLIPATAGKILDEFKAQKASIGPSGSINQMVKQAEDAAYGEISDLLKVGKLSPEVADQLRSLIQKNIPFDQYKAFVLQLMQEGKLSPDIAKLKIGDYQQVKNMRDMAEKLNNLSGNNASVTSYTDELKRLVKEGVLTPDQAAQLLREYQAANSKTPLDVKSLGAETEAFAKLQQKLATGSTQVVTATTGDFTAAEAQASQQSAEQEQARIEAMTAAMTAKGGEYVSAWQAPTMAYKAGSETTTSKGATGTGNSTGIGNASTAAAGAGSTGVTLIKSGTIAFAVLDTTANSDYPDSPVMATIVDGPLKGAKLLGKLVTAKGVSGQLDRVSLNFTLMNLDSWPKSKSITAYAIDPDTARTVLASQVDYHYMQKFGAMMATSFLQGYASAITQAGTSTTGIFGTSTTHPALSPSQKIATALGQMGQTVGAATQNYINIPPTVKVDSGVGLGILFMADVTQG